MPDIENPQTYGEWYWNLSVAASELRDENTEKVLAPILAALLADAPDLSELTTGMRSFFEALTLPKHPGLAQFIALASGEFAADFVRDIMQPGLTALKRVQNRKAKETWLTAQQAVTLSSRKKITDEYFYLLTSSEGYEDLAADSLYTSLMPYPEIPEIIRWARYNSDPDNPRGKAWEKFYIPEDDYDLWEWIALQKLTTEQAQQLFIRGKIPEYEFMAEIGRIGWHNVDRESIKELAYEIPNAMLLIQGDLLYNPYDEAIIEDIKRAGIHPDYAQKYMDGILTKPSSIDVIAYELRRDTSLSNLSSELRKIGIHPNYHNLYKELAYPIPPVQDIITMAVREAFTPDIASKFGQYEGIPSEYVQWVQKKGLTKEWAERYWAAHWSLPSPQQGFEMLHRGIINRDELSMLLRALDIMPFWRERLIEMSYRPLTRVDVRRMYQVGTLDSNGVLKAYKDVGYSDANAELMTDFTIRYVRNSLSRFTSSDVIKAFTDRFIDEGQARNLLREIGVKDAEINNIISTATHKREWAYKKERIDAIENLYKKGRMEENQVRRELINLNLPQDHIDTLLQQWVLKAEEARIATWTTAQTLSFLKSGLINESRATEELQLLGYTPERIDVYIRSAKV